MSIRILPRELGIVLTCNGTGHYTEQCKTLQTGQILAGAVRTYAKTIGWGRGLRKGHKRRDLCPDCMPVEKQLHAKQKADWAAEQKRREEVRKAKREEAAAAKAPKKPRKRKADSSATPTASPSAASAPAPAT